VPRHVRARARKLRNALEATARRDCVVARWTDMRAEVSKFVAKALCVVHTKCDEALQRVASAICDSSLPFKL
jgi:aminopeptidase C